MSRRAAEVVVIEILPNVLLDENELVVSASRSGGPGGQHVNKTATRVTVALDVARSASLSPAQKRAVLERLASRIRGGGTIRVTAQSSRSQHANREAAVARLVELLARALTPPRPRVATRVPGAEKRRRLEAKRRRAALKSARAGGLTTE